MTMAYLFGLIIHFIITTIRINSYYIGLLQPIILNPNSRFYDFIDDKPIGYSKINQTKI